MKRTLLLILLSLLVSCQAPDARAPATPTNLSTQAGNATVTLNWTAGSEDDLKGYNLYWGTSSTTLSNTLFVAKPATSKAVVGLTNRTLYFFAIDAEDNSGNKSEQTPPTSATPIEPDTTPPQITLSVPANAATDVAINSAITLTFSEAMNPGSLKASLSPALELQGPSWNPGNTEAVFTHLNAFSANTPYTLSVQASDAAGNALAASIGFTSGSNALALGIWDAGQWDQVIWGP